MTSTLSPARATSAVTGAPVAVLPAAARRLSVVATAGAAVAALVGVLPDLALAPLAIALAVGLPHGAVDHLVVMRRLGGALGLVAGTVGYLGAAVATLGLAGAAPLATWTAFLVLSVWHFGTADREYLAALGEQPSWLFAVSAGLVPVGGLMVRGAADLRPLAAALDGRVVQLLSPGILVGVTLALVALVPAAVVLEGFRGNGRAVADLSLLCVLFLVAPPLWAFGVYFGLWHALRHVARMVTDEAPWSALLAARGLGAATAGFLRDAALPTAVALAAGAVLALAGRDMGGAALTAMALQVTAAVTFPHAATVAFLDRVGTATG